jgi:hypothetical protein
MEPIDKSMRYDLEGNYLMSIQLIDLSRHISTTKLLILEGTEYTEHRALQKIVGEDSLGY